MPTLSSLLCAAYGFSWATTIIAVLLQLVFGDGRVTQQDTLALVIAMSIALAYYFDHTNPYKR